jgi:hypothetical protein
MNDDFKYRDRVEPRMITSPFDGNPVRPKLQVKVIDNMQITEAHWYCSTTGRFIRKGTVEIKKLEK